VAAAQLPSDKKKKKKKVERSGGGVVWKWKWNLHRGDEVEAMQVQWHGRGHEVALVEGKKWRRVYTMGTSLVVCREGYKHEGIQDTNRYHQKESVI